MFEFYLVIPLGIRPSWGFATAWIQNTGEVVFNSESHHPMRAKYVYLEGIHLYIRAPLVASSEISSILNRYFELAN